MREEKGGGKKKMEGVGRRVQSTRGQAWTGMAEYVGGYDIYE